MVLERLKQNRHERSELAKQNKPATRAKQPMTLLYKT